MRIPQFKGSAGRPFDTLLLLGLVSPLACSADAAPTLGRSTVTASAGTTATPSDPAGGGSAGLDEMDPTVIVDIEGSGGACDGATGDCPGAEAICGNGILQDTGEECDDSNILPGDGCSASCVVEPGYLCATPGARCQAAECGDGLLAGLELCDDGNSISGDGCTETCSLEAGFDCAVPGAACLKTVCGDALVEGTEACDDGTTT